MRIAPEGMREIAVATLVLGGATALSIWLYWPVALVPIALWIWVVAFFRDPIRQREFLAGELCAPADGTVTEISRLEGYEGLNGPALRIGMFLSLFNVHVNRSPCAGNVSSTCYAPGEFLDARHPESGARNESNTVVLDPSASMPGPVIIRQVAGLVARRIISHVKPGDHLHIGERFGLIKFGSRTELIIPALPDTEVLVALGDKVRGGLTILAKQPVNAFDQTVKEHTAVATR